MSRHELTKTLQWMTDGTAYLFSVVEKIPNSGLGGPSALPGWTRAHVIGHVARNAEALGRLASWARTGVESPMYESPEQRAADIEESAAYPPSILRHDLLHTADALAREFALQDEQTWQAEVRNAQGKTIPAMELPWMRIREVWLHAVDLDSGGRMADLPPEVLDLLLDDVTDTLSAREGCPSAVLVASDRQRSWQLGVGEPVRVSGTAAELAGWVTGRNAGGQPRVDGDRLPELPAWL
jgi:maleylpyruvate isomerase